MYDCVAYISSPLRVPNGEFGPFTPYQLNQNIRVAAELAVVAWKAGWAAICPHLNTLGFDGCGTDSNQIIAGDVAMIKRLIPDKDCLIMGPGWRHSEGCRIEYAAAMNHGIRVIESAEFDNLDDMLVKLRIERSKDEQDS